MLKFRRIFLIVAFILVSLGLGFLIFYFFFYSPTVELRNNTNPINNSSVGTLPSPNDGMLPVTKPSSIEFPQDGTSKEPSEVSKTAKGGITETDILYQNPVYNTTISQDGKDIISYDVKQGKFIRVDSEGKVNIMSNEVFHNVEKVTWATNKTQAVLEYPDGSNIVYNFRSAHQVTLPKHWQDFSFSPLSNQLIAKSLSSNIEYNWLIITDPDGGNIKPVEHLGSNGDKVYVNWSPNNKIVGMYIKSKDIDRQNLYFIGQNQENFPLTLIEGYGFQGQWSQKGDNLLYSVYNRFSEFNPRLWTVTTDDNNLSQYRKNLNVATWADKCTFFDNTSIYCAVPESLPEGSGIYPELSDAIPDDIYKIDINTGEKILIAKPQDKDTISQIFVSKDEKYLFYINKNNILKKVILK